MLPSGDRKKLFPEGSICLTAAGAEAGLIWELSLGDLQTIMRTAPLGIRGIHSARTSYIASKEVLIRPSSVRMPPKVEFSFQV